MGYGIVLVFVIVSLFLALLLALFGVSELLQLLKGFTLTLDDGLEFDI